MASLAIKKKEDCICGEYFKYSEFDNLCSRCFIKKNPDDEYSQSMLLKLYKNRSYDNKYLDENKYEELKEIVRDRFTSRDGYIPHYSKKLSEWGKISTWDHNQIGTALLVFFDDSSFNYDIHEKVSEVIYGQIFNTLSDEMQDFLNKEYDKKEAEKAQLSLF